MSENSSNLDTTKQQPIVPAQSRMIRGLLILTGWFLLLVLWDPIIEITLHLLHYLIEILEISLEYLLEVVLHLEGHDAQIATAWSGLGGFIALGVHLYRGIKNRFNTRYGSMAGLKGSLRQFMHTHWILMTLMLTVYVATLALI